MIGPLAGCWIFSKEDKTRLTKDERLKTKKMLTAMNKLHQAAEEAFPIAVLGLVGWSLIWIYRGYKYPSVKNKISLSCYIDKTFHIAKTFGVATFLAGTGYALRSHKEESEVKEGENKVKAENKVKTETKVTKVTTETKVKQEK